MDGYVRKRAVAVIAIKTATAMSGGDNNVEQPVIVVIEYRSAAPGAGLIEADFRRNIFVAQFRALPARLHLHPEFRGNPIGIAADMLRGKPHPYPSPFIGRIGSHRVQAGFHGLFKPPRAIKSDGCAMPCARLILRILGGPVKFRESLVPQTAF